MICHTEAPFKVTIKPQPVVQISVPSGKPTNVMTRAAGNTSTPPAADFCGSLKSCV